jgi:CRP-like cAMP-binding protein
MTVAKAPRRFDSHAFLSTGEGRQMVLFPRNHTIFAQGHASDGIFFIQHGNVRLSLKSEDGKKATLAF